jgi:hypothetical protein
MFSIEMDCKGTKYFETCKFYCAFLATNYLKTVIYYQKTGNIIFVQWQMMSNSDKKMAAL